MQSPYLLILVFVIILLIFPFQIGIKADYSPYKNLGFLAIKIFKKRIKLFEFEFEKLGIVLHTKKGKKYQPLEFNFSKRKFVYFENLFFQFKDKAKIKYMSFVSKIGMQDAFKTAMVIGGLNQVFYSFFGFIKNDKQTATIIIQSQPEWNHKVFEMSICFRFSVSIYEILYCLLFANLKARRVK